MELHSWVMHKKLLEALLIDRQSERIETHECKKTRCDVSFVEKKYDIDL